ncbi:DUF4240 domain-containing protein [Micromonospora peucetia]|uniref:DUF4240 domain-containing protein n=1 Tax=Micromonospora peucetia TaxID=47871 RepID=UPI00331BF48C
MSASPPSGRFGCSSPITSARCSSVSFADAATLLLGLLDDDDFLAVQDWIVSHGRHTMQRVQDDPDSLVELAPDRHNARIDWFCGLPLEANIAATGAPFAVDGPSGPDTRRNSGRPDQRDPHEAAFPQAHRLPRQQSMDRASLGAGSRLTTACAPRPDEYT